MSCKVPLKKIWYEYVWVMSKTSTAKLLANIILTTSLHDAMRPAHPAQMARMARWLILWVPCALGAMEERCRWSGEIVPKNRLRYLTDLTKCWVSEVYKFDWKRVVSSWLSENGGISYVYRWKWVGIRRISRRFILEAVMATRPGASLLEARERFRALWSEWWYHCITYSFGALWVSKFVKAGTRGYSVKM